MDIFIEVIGYTGMAIVLASFLMKDIKWVRIVNMVGASLCLVYGIFTRTIPTACLNGALFLINAVYMTIYYVKAHKKKVQEKENTDNKEEL